MLRSRANALLSVRRVTEVNAGRKTAGIDGTVVVTAPGKVALAVRVQRHDASWTPKPVKRVYIAKRRVPSSTRGPEQWPRHVSRPTVRPGSAVGDFNDWDPNATPYEPGQPAHGHADGGFRKALRLPLPRRGREVVQRRRHRRLREQRPRRGQRRPRSQAGSLPQSRAPTARRVGGTTSEDPEVLHAAPGPPPGHSTSRRAAQSSRAARPDKCRPRWRAYAGLWSPVCSTRSEPALGTKVDCSPPSQSTVSTVPETAVTSPRRGGVPTFSDSTTMWSPTFTTVRPPCLAAAEASQSGSLGERRVVPGPDGSLHLAVAGFHGARVGLSVKAATWGQLGLTSANPSVILGRRCRRRLGAVEPGAGSSCRS